MKQRFFGLDVQIEETMRQLQRNLKVREQGLPNAQLPPVGMFLFSGQQGLGKRSLGIEFGRQLYEGSSVAVLDLSEAGASLEPVLVAARTNPYQTFVLENADQAPRRVQDDLLAIVAGQGLTDLTNGARVSFRHCCLFLLMHRPVADREVPVMSSGAGGFTVAAERTAEGTSLDFMLAQAVHGMVPFHLPAKQEVAQAIAWLMEQECRKYQLTLGSIAPATLAREVFEVSTVGSFRAAPSRVSRVLSRPIHEAIDAKRTTVEVT
jgi:hypothetical protein